MITFFKTPLKKSLLFALSFCACSLFLLPLSADEEKDPSNQVAFAHVSKEASSSAQDEQDACCSPAPAPVCTAPCSRPSTNNCSTCCSRPCCCFCVPHWLFEAKVHAFRPQDSLLREIYDDVWADYQLLLGYRFCDQWSVVATGNYMYNSGNSKGLHESTKIYIVPATLELRYHFFLSSCIDLYLGAGPRYYWVRCKNKQGGSTKTDKSNRLGAYGELGFLFHLSTSFFVDLSVGYSYGRLHFATGEKYVKGNTLKVGGLHGGLGLGFKF